MIFISRWLEFYNCPPFPQKIRSNAEASVTTHCTLRAPTEGPPLPTDSEHHVIFVND
jgi:hypothetical protein